MASAGSRIPFWIIALLAALCLAVLSWSVFGFVLPFREMTRTWMLEMRVAGYDATDIDAMRGVLARTPAARDLLFGMHAGPELVFPALLTALIIAVLVGLQPGGVYFGRPMHPLLIGAFYAVPFVYAVADYAENMLTTNVFGDGVAWSFAAAALPWASSLKFTALAISLIVIIRFAIVRLMPPGDQGAP
ncbi:hypothetical protein ASC97_01335 [Rhizobium sp. Root1203]|uniref:hypothetical protein n=1 Tax=Rhizobium sp. Root1203 TaxID=1736427 RepID=UPI00070C89E8|nr:hypothetical protein [Rhizobium sp. Root1203]KQV32268.1 hypothetical protein ASC97_01335 [Rhizobium sp. Root1203]